jgi:hypothetical protein
MKVFRRDKTSNRAQVDRQVSDDDVFEHVISGVRLSHVFQTIRDVEFAPARVGSPDDSSVPLDDDKQSQ